MNSLSDFARSTAVLISSCDIFFDCWRPFAFFFRKFWPECPFPVYLLVNELRVRSSFINAIAVGPDRGWASNMTAALRLIPAERVLYFQEDYFLTQPVAQEQLARDFRYAVDNQVDAFCFRARSQLEPAFAPINQDFGIVPEDSDGRTRCQLTLWKRDRFLATLREGETAWAMEAQGSDRTRDMKVVSYSTRERAPIPYLMSAIVRGLWTREAIAMCHEHGVRIAPTFRGVHSDHRLVAGFRRRQTRRRGQEALARAKQALIDLDV